MKSTDASPTYETSHPATSRTIIQFQGKTHHDNLMSVAQATAEAAKEGRMFHKKVLVSDKEKAMLERIQQALNA
jgi:hypothetical protein